MPLTDHTDNITRAINDNGELVHDIAAQDVHVKCVFLCESGESALENNGVTTSDGKTNLCSYMNRRHSTTHSAQMMDRGEVGQAKFLQENSHENGSIRSAIAMSTGLA